MRRRVRPIALFGAFLLGVPLLFGPGCHDGDAQGTPPAPRPQNAESAESADATFSLPAERDRLHEAAEAPLGDHVRDRYPASLEQILEKRFLRVLTSRNAFDFFIHQGERGGYQYEMVEAFTRFLNRRHLGSRGELDIQFELIPVDDDQLIPMLREGAADLIAARLTITPDRAALVAFSRPYRSVDEVIVTHEETPALARLEDLSGRTVAVRESSSYYESLSRLNDELARQGRAPVEIVRVDDALETERILELVAAHRFPYTVVDSMLAELAIEIHPRLRIVPGVALRSDGELAWATRPGATALIGEMDTFLDRYDQGSLLGNLTKKKYFETESRIADRLRSGSSSSLSDYDDLFRMHAETFGLDWRLVAAMAHQESRFDPLARNRSGAVGLLQIKPSTAREPYIDIPEVAGIEHTSDNVEAGLKYLDWIKARYLDSVPEMREKDRVRMALAAYNAGPRTLLRARIRARELGYDPNRWFRHVELAMLDLRRVEPVEYVSEINQRYLAYLLLLEPEADEETR